jgi:hypothetical protein
VPGNTLHLPDVARGVAAHHAFMNTSMNTHLALANEHEIVRRADRKRRRWLGRR